jgi:ATP-dependent helicase/nuclease subunit B
MALFGPDSVYAMPGEVRFADSLALGLLAEFPAPLDLASAQIFLPNRRAIRALSEALLRSSDGKALILPRLRALGDVSDEDIETFRSGDLLDLPPPLSPTQRMLALLPLVRDGLSRMYARRSSFAEVLRYTRALLHIFDALQYGSITQPDIKALASSGDFADHWGRVLSFLDIALEYWPQKLAEMGASDPIAYRIAHIDALTARWTGDAPTVPIIAAGSTGTIPAVRGLLKRIASLPQGCVVLPHIVAPNSADIWAALGPTHPAFALKQLIDALDRTPDSIAPWPHLSAADCSAERLHMVAQAFLPADQTAAWRGSSTALPDNVAVLEAAHPAEEAQAIALAMRAALDVPDQTAALVTPDRALARRVAAQLQRFGVDIDDSAGVPLADTRPAIFMALLCDVLLQNCAPVPLLALLKHPLCKAGAERLPWLHQVRQLDANILRGPRPAPGLLGLRAADTQNILPTLFDAIESSIGPWLAAHSGTSQSLSDWVAQHVAAAEALAGDALWAEEAGRALQQQLLGLEGADTQLSAADYALLFADLLKAISLRPAYGKHPRLFLWGPLEARLQRCDVMILGGLNEGVWPQPPEVDPVLNESMRQSLGLPTTEFRIGQSAMDFCHALGARELLITRAHKSADVPTIASRFLQRLDNVCAAPLPRHTDLLELARGIDQPARFVPAEEPLPAPALTLRPRTLYVTDIERLRRNPYDFYARKILRLRLLDELDADPGAADKGSRIHDALDAYLKAGSENLLQHMKIAFADLWERPQVQALWMPRLTAIAAWIAEQHDPAWLPLSSEHEGSWTPASIAPSFRVRGRADRIDLAADKSALRIIDYKSSSAPSSKQALSGFALQLPLLALIGEHGGFETMEALPVQALEAWVLKGREDDAGSRRNLFKDRNKDIRADVLGAAQDAVQQLIALFDKAETAYRYKSGPARGGGDDYAHLARVDAWQGRKP